MAACGTLTSPYSLREPHRYQHSLSLTPAPDHSGPAACSSQSQGHGVGKMGDLGQAKPGSDLTMSGPAGKGPLWADLALFLHPRGVPLGVELLLHVLGQTPPL